jgi:hypothetical protein
MRGMTSRPLFLILALAAGCNDTLKLPPPSDGGAGADLHIAAATQLAAATTLTSCLAVDASGVYWSDSGNGQQILRVALGGGTPVTIATGGDKPGCVAVDGSGVYYTDNGALLKAPLGGGTPMTLVTSQHFLKGVDAYNGKNAIVRVPTGGGSVQVVSATLLGNPGGLAIDASNAYVSDGSGTFAAPLANPTATITFGSSSIKPTPFAVGSGHLAMVELTAVGSGDLALFRLDGQGRVQLSSAIQPPLAVDDRGVYVKGANTLERLALDGSGATLLATQAVRALALDATTVYFTDGAGIYSLPR